MNKTLYDEVIDRLKKRLENDDPLRIDRAADDALVEVIEKNYIRIEKELNVRIEFERMFDFATASGHLHAAILTKNKSGRID